jgi:hypothetical protein
MTLTSQHAIRKMRCRIRRNDSNFRANIFSFLAGPARLSCLTGTSATYNEGPYLRPSSQGSWMEAMRARRKCVPIVFMALTHPELKPKI